MSRRRDPHGPHRGRRGARLLGDEVEGVARGRGSARALVHEEGAREAAASGDAEGRRERAIVGDDDHLDVESLELGAFGGEAEVEPVAGVVLDDEEASGRAGDVADGGEHRGDGGGREHVAAHRRVEHPVPDESGVRGLVARSPAGDERHLVLVDVGSHDHLDVGEAVEELNPGVRLDEALQHLGDRRARVVEELVAHC